MYSNVKYIIICKDVDDENKKSLILEFYLCDYSVGYVSMIRHILRSTQRCFPFNLSACTYILFDAQCLNGFDPMKNNTPMPRVVEFLSSL